MATGSDRKGGQALDDNECARPLSSRWWVWALVALGAAVTGFVIAVELPSISRWDRLTAFLPRFLTSSGFGALATVLAALVAFLGVSQQLRQVVQQNTFARRHAHNQATDAEWWQSLEWVTARVFPGHPANRDISLPFALEVVVALHERSRTEEQGATSLALLNELHDAPGVLRDPLKDQAAEQRLSSFLHTVGTTTSAVPGTDGASELLFELQCRRAFERLRAGGFLDQVLISTGASDSGADAELFRGSRRIAVETKRYSASVTGLSNAASQVRHAARSDEGLLIVTPEPIGDRWRQETQGVMVIAVPERADVVEFLVAELREVLA